MTALEAHFPGELRVYGDAEELARAGAELFVSTAAESISARGRFRVALSGGSTPKRVYELLAVEASRSRVDWEHTDIFWGDERYVPADDPKSNFRMTNEVLLRNVLVPPANVHRVPTEISPPSSAAAAYQDEIRKSFGDSRSFPQFDLIYLGLGSNGHTASLFPRSPALKEMFRLVVDDFVAEVNAWRITMSAPLLNRGRTVAFLIQGQEKAQVLRDVMLGPRDPERLPAQLIAPEGQLLWLVDKAAGALVLRPAERRTA